MKKKKSMTKKEVSSLAKSMYESLQKEIEENKNLGGEDWNKMMEEKYGLPADLNYE